MNHNLLNGSMTRCCCSYIFVPVVCVIFFLKKLDKKDESSESSELLEC